MQPFLQAETEELARKVESLTAENASIRSEIDRVTEHSGKLRLENVILMVNLCSISIIPTCFHEYF